MWYLPFLTLKLLAYVFVSVSYFHVLVWEHMEVGPLRQKCCPPSGVGIADFFASIISLQPAPCNWAGSKQKIRLYNQSVPIKHDVATGVY